MVYKIHWKDSTGPHSRMINTIDIPDREDLVLIVDTQQILRVLWRLFRCNAVLVVGAVLVSDETAADVMNVLVGETDVPAT